MIEEVACALNIANLRAGINFNDGFGGGDTIANNLVFSTCRESGDHGPINVSSKGAVSV